MHVHVSVTLRNAKLLCLGITVHVHNEWKAVHSDDPRGARSARAHIDECAQAH